MMINISFMESIMTKTTRKKKEFDDDRIDIIQLDIKIKKLIEDETTNLSTHLLKLNQLQNTHSCTTIYRDKKVLENDIANLTQTILDVENNTLLAEYIYLTSAIVDEYKKLNFIPVTVSFFNNAMSDPNEDRKNVLINQFINIASKYIDIPTYKKETIEKFSCSCGNTGDFSQNCNSIKCEQCGEEKHIYCVQTSFKDIDRVNLSQKYKYKRKVHFRDTLNQYQHLNAAYLLQINLLLCRLLMQNICID